MIITITIVTIVALIFIDREDELKPPEQLARIEAVPPPTRLTGDGGRLDDPEAEQVRPTSTSSKKFLNKPASKP